MARRVPGTPVVSVGEILGKPGKGLRVAPVKGKKMPRKVNRTKENSYGRLIE